MFFCYFIKTFPWSFGKFLSRKKSESERSHMSRGKNFHGKSSRPVGKVLFGKDPEGKVPFGKFPVGKYPVWQFPVGKSNLESFLQPLKMLEVWKLSYFFRNHDDEWSFSLSNNTVFKTPKNVSSKLQTKRAVIFIFYLRKVILNYYPINLRRG